MQSNSPRKLPQNFSILIQDVFNSRKAKNSSYSLRAFARDLEISSGKLSDILKNKVGISDQTASKISEKLNLSEEDKKLFLNLTKQKKSKDQNSKQTYQFNSSYVVIKDDDYERVLTHWYHFALAELIALKEFRNDDLWISERLGIAQSEVRPTLERLKRVRLVEEIADGQLKQTYDLFVSPGGTPSDTAKRFHKQILDKAQKALDIQKIEDRNFTAGFLRVRKSDLPYVDQKIREFRRQLMQELESGEDHDSVYAFSIQFFQADAGK